MRSLIIVLFLLTGTTAFAQDLSGTWEGLFGSDMVPKLGRRSFFMHLELKQEGRQLSGYFYNSDIDSPDKANVLYQVSGVLGKKRAFPVRMTKGDIPRDDLRPDIAFVFNELMLYYVKTDTAEYLYGPWFPSGSSPRSDGAGGYVRLRLIAKPLYERSIQKKLEERMPKKRVKKETHSAQIIKADTIRALPVVKPYNQRNNSVLQTFIADSSQLTLSLYDAGEIDDDSVSVYINDSLVVSHLRLTAQPQNISLNLVKNKTYRISLFAENLGKIPPNTAYLSIQQGKQKWREIFLSADYSQNAVIVIQLR
jgi:hypothetical protein